MSFELYYDSEWVQRGAYFVHHRRRFVQTWNAVAELELPIGSVLDIGGVGPIAAYLAGIGWKVCGTDVDLRGPLPIPDQCIDLALCTEVIEHIKDIDSCQISDLEAFNYSGVMNMLCEIRRTLQPGGILLITTPNAASMHMLAKWLYGELLLADPHHVREFTVADLDRIARQCGLKPVLSKIMDSWSLGGCEAVDQVADLLESLSSLPKLERGDNIVALYAVA